MPAPAPVLAPYTVHSAHTLDPHGTCSEQPDSHARTLAAVAVVVVVVVVAVVVVVVAAAAAAVGHVDEGNYKEVVPWSLLVAVIHREHSKPCR